MTKSDDSIAKEKHVAGKSAIEKAMALLLFKDRTRQELAEKLKKAGFSEEEVEAAIEYVDGYGYLDDFRYASIYISYHKDRKSSKELKYKLLEKGVAADLIDMALEEEYDSSDNALDALLRKRLKGKEISSITREEKDKHIAYLARKGFSFGEIQKAIERFENE